MVKEGPFTIHIEENYADERLDVVVAAYLEDCSRSYASTLIKKGVVKVRDSLKKPSYRLRRGEIVTGLVPPPEPADITPERTNFGVLYEDDHLMVIDKPPGLVVHPAPGHARSTLVHGLLFHCPDMKGVGGKLRPGIVHRLDKDTSGILLIAKSSSAHAKLSAQFKTRKIKKEYLALVWGRMPAAEGKIDLPIGRHPKDRKKMSVHSYAGRNAETLWKVEEEYKDASLVRLDLKTGRTHQIRVHCAAIHHPVLGDQTYGKGKRLVVETKDERKMPIPRQMLHAWKIGFEHPEERKSMSFQADIPEDMKEILALLRLLHRV